jgi:hypothetical protein
LTALKLASTKRLSRIWRRKALNKHGLFAAGCVVCSVLLGFSFWFIRQNFFQFNSPFFYIFVISTASLLGLLNFFLKNNGTKKTKIPNAKPSLPSVSSVVDSVGASGYTILPPGRILTSSFELEIHEAAGYLPFARSAAPTAPAESTSIPTESTKRRFFNAVE